MKRFDMLFKFALLLLIAMLPAEATMLLYEGFDVAGAPGDLLSGNGWTDKDGLEKPVAGSDPVVYEPDTGAVVRDGLTFTGYPSTGKSAATVRQEESYRDVGNLGFFETMGTIYVSGLFTADIGSSSWGNSVLSGMGIGSDSTNNPNHLGLGIGKVGSVNEMRAVAGYFSGGGQVTDSGGAITGSTVLTNGAVYFMLAKLRITDASTDQMDVSLMVVEAGNAIAAAEGDVSWDMTGSVTYAGNFNNTWNNYSELDRLWLVQGNTPGSGGVTNISDEFRLSTSYEGALPSAIPEPSVLVLLGAAMAVLRIYRRR